MEAGARYLLAWRLDFRRAVDERFLAVARGADAWSRSESIESVFVMQSSHVSWQWGSPESTVQHVGLAVCFGHLERLCTQNRVKWLQTAFSALSLATIRSTILAGMATDPWLWQWGKTIESRQQQQARPAEPFGSRLNLGEPSRS